MSLPALRLIPACFRFVFSEALRSRAGFILTVFAGLAVLQTALSLRARSDAGGWEGFIVLLMLGYWAAAAPLCRSWIGEDVHAGYGALWLQKPVRPLDFYLARLFALAAWAAIATLGVSILLAGPPVMFGATRMTSAVYAVVGMGWIPPVLVILSFFGSAAGARNGALVGYGMVVGGFFFEGVRGALSLGALAPLVSRLFPPARQAVEATRRLEAGSVSDALTLLSPMLVYALLFGTVGVVLALRVPGRLARGG